MIRISTSYDPEFAKCSAKTTTASHVDLVRRCCQTTCAARTPTRTGANWKPKQPERKAKVDDEEMRTCRWGQKLLRRWSADGTGYQIGFVEGLFRVC